MKKIYFIINSCFNHRTILNQGSGASELLFYLTAEKISNLVPVTIFHHEETQKLDKIQYIKIEENMTYNFENYSHVIIQRDFGLGIKINKFVKNKEIKLFVWSHDYLEGDIKNLTGEFSALEINNFYHENNISIIGVSLFHQKNLLSYFPNVKIIIIYNAIFPELYDINPNIRYFPNKLIFASNWAKGLDKVLKISQSYYQINPYFKLILIKPNYCDWDPELEKYPFIKKLGCIKNKKIYSELLQSCLGVISTSFPETFGCVFAEALHLGVPVIGDNSIKAGFQEIIPPEYLCDFNNPNNVIKLIEKIRNNRPIVKLESKFYIDSIIKDWIN